MNKVQFFAGSDVLLLQQNINEWLSQNEGIQIIQCNLDSIIVSNTPGNRQNTEKHVFYILYHAIRNKRKKKAAVATEAIPGREHAN